MNPLAKTGLSYAGTVSGTIIATIAFMSDHKVDLYAIWDQLNVVIAAITKLVSLATPIVIGAYAIWRTTAKVRLAELVQDPKAVEAAKEMPITAKSTQLADAMKS